MPDPVSTTRTASITVTIHTETVSLVEVVDLSNDRDRLVSLQIGDDRSGVNLLGQLDSVRQLVVEADRQLTLLAEGER